MYVFCSILPKLMDHLYEVASLALNAWYLDDGTLVGPPGDLWRTGQEDVGKLGESKTRTEEGSLQMRIAHVMQNPQALLNSVLEHSLTKGRGTPKEGEPIPGNRNVRWQGREGGITIPRDEEERLAPVEMETNSRALRLHNLKSPL